MIYIMNHHRRNPQKLVDEIIRQGYDCIVKVDHTDFYKKRDRNRYRGINQNFLSIMLAEDYTNDWKIMFHDDIELKDGVLDKMHKIIEQAPQHVISFFNAPNNDYDKAYERGHRVLKTYQNIWYPAVAFHRSFCEGYAKWFMEVVPKEHQGAIPEDSFIPHYLTMNETPAYVIIPSLVQHAGYDQSTFKNPAKVGGRYRIAYNYDPNQDVDSVNWKQEFAEPYKTMAKYQIKKFKI